MKAEDLDIAIAFAPADTAPHLDTELHWTPMPPEGVTEFPGGPITIAFEIGEQIVYIRIEEHRWSRGS
ncbi:MAG TPA: hypothetical protein VIL25_06020 [Vicinamibacterales bacterium]